MDPAGDNYILKNKKILSYDSEIMDLNYYLNLYDRKPINYTRHFDMVYTLPFLDKDFCKELLVEIKHIEQNYKYDGNIDEHISVRSPELKIANVCPRLNKHLIERVCAFGNPFFEKCFDTPIQSGTVHVTKYDKDWSGNEHTDLCDVSVLVSLNDDFEGGGTEFKGGVIRPLPIGSALVFPSYITRHKGLSITRGNRYLLVFWLNRTLKGIM